MIFVLPPVQFFFCLLISCVVSVFASILLEFFFGLKTLKKIEKSGDVDDFKFHNYVIVHGANFFISVLSFYFVSKFFGC